MRERSSCEGTVREFDEIEQATLAPGTIDDASGTAFSMSRTEEFTGYMEGIIDEVRISNVARSADWLRASFNNQDAPESFYTVGSQEAQ